MHRSRHEQACGYVGYAQREHEITERDNLAQRGQGDPVRKEAQVVASTHQVVAIAIVDGTGIAAGRHAGRDHCGCRDGHPSVDRDHCEVGQQPEGHHSDAGQQCVAVGKRE